MGPNCPRNSHAVWAQIEILLTAQIKIKARKPRASVEVFAGLNSLGGVAYLHGMSARNAKQAADEIIRRLDLLTTAHGPKLQLVAFNSDNDCRFFYPRRALGWQRQVNTYVARALREQHHIRVQRIVLTPQDYETWRLVREDSPQLRREFADQHIRLLS
jgi:hypothetical protein